MATPGTYVALLRGINVGGRNKLPMRQLVEIFEAVGAQEVRTYIQSGNVMFRATAALARRLPVDVEKAIAAETGLAVPVVVRSARQLEAIASDNPVLQPGIESKLLHVAFLSGKPSAKSVASLDPERSAPDVFEVRGAEIYLRLARGAAHTKLTADYFDRRLGLISTARNWNTVLALVEQC